MKRKTRVENIRRDSPVMKCKTRVENIRWDMRKEKQVSKDLSPHVEERNGSKVGILRRQERIHGKGRKL